MSYVAYDPPRRPISVADARLNHVFHRQPERCATVDEYASAAGMDPEQVLELLSPYLSNGTLGIEVYADLLFVHTAPTGRPTPSHLPEVAPNLWERIRNRAPLARAYALWRLIRSLEHAGWKVETNVKEVTLGLGWLPTEPYLGLNVKGQPVPVIPYPAPNELPGPNGLCEAYQKAGARGIAVTCDNGALDQIVTAVRAWVLGRGEPSYMTILVLEAPRFNPTLIRPSDNSVTPINITRHELNDL